MFTSIAKSTLMKRQASSILEIVIMTVNTILKRSQMQKVEALPINIISLIK